MMCGLSKSIFLIVLLCCIHFPVKASLLLGGDLTVAEDGEVIVTVLDINAVFSNDLFLFTDDGIADNDFFISNNQITPTGTQINLGSFAAGEILLFYIFVQDTDYIFYSGNDSSLNPDGILHTMVDNEYDENTVYVGFEDIFGGGDFDFDDVTFSFFNVAAIDPIVSIDPDVGETPDSSSNIPEPTSVILWLLTLASIGLYKIKI